MGFRIHLSVALLLTSVACVAWVGCRAPASPSSEPKRSSQGTPARSVRVVGIEQLETSISGVLLVKPNHYMGSYDRLMVDPIFVTFDRDSKKPSPSDIKRLETYLRKATARELVNVDPSKIVSDPGPCVMRMQTAFLDVTLPDMQPSSGSNTTFIDSFGSATLFHELRDSMTGTVLLRYMGRRHARGGQAIGWVAPWSGLTRTFNQMLSDLQKGLVETVPLSRANEGRLARCSGLIHKRIDASSVSGEG